MHNTFVAMAHPGGGWGIAAEMSGVFTFAYQGFVI